MSEEQQVTEGGEPLAADVVLANHNASVREEAIAAVKAATQAEETPAEAPAGEKTAPERGDDGKFKPKAAAKAAETPAEAPPAVDPAAEVARILAEREEKAEAKRVRSEIEAERAAAKQEREAAAKERADAAAFIAKLRQNPRQAIQEAGWKGDELVLDLARDGTPEGQMAAQLRAEREARQSLEQQLKSFLEEHKGAQQRQAEEAERANVRAVEQRFVTAALNSEKHPTLARLFTGDEQSVLQQGYRVAQEYHRKTGEWLNEADIAAYLELKWSERLGTEATPAKGKQGSAPQRSAKGSATVTQAAASERRTISKPPEEMTMDERIAEAKAAARKTIREYEASKET